MLIDLGYDLLVFLGEVSEAVFGGHLFPVLIESLDELVLDLEDVVDKLFVLVNPLAEEGGEAVQGYGRTVVVDIDAAAAALVGCAAEGDGAFRVDACPGDPVALFAEQFWLGDLELAEHDLEVFVPDDFLLHGIRYVNKTLHLWS